MPDEPAIGAPEEPNAPDDAWAPPPGPSPRLIAAAFVAVVVAGVCGAVIGLGLVRVGCHGECSTARGAAVLIGGVAGAAGVGVVVVLVLRAMSEWRRGPGRAPLT